MLRSFADVSSKWSRRKGITDLMQTHPEAVKEELVFSSYHGENDPPCQHQQQNQNLVTQPFSQYKGEL